MELRESLFFWKISVPESYYLKYVEFSCQITADPSVCKVHEIDVKLIQMLEYPSISLLYEFLHFIDNFVNPRLHLRVIILNIVDKFA